MLHADETHEKSPEGIVTTPRGRDDLLPRAARRAEMLGLPLVERRSTSIEALLERHGASGLWVETDGQPVVQTRLGPIVYHEGSAVLRTRNRSTEPNTLHRAMAVEPVDRILDATLGMGLDSLVAATALTRGGAITGLEKSTLLHGLVRHGLAAHKYKTNALKDAASRIRAIHADHREFLSSCCEREFDVVYFDAMFEEAISASAMMLRIRQVADESPLLRESIELARFAARKRVVIKGRRGYDMGIDFDEFIPSGGSVFYGVIYA